MGESRPIEGTEGADDPFIGYFEDGKLYEIAADGGAPELVVSPQEPEQFPDPSSGAAGLIRWPHFLPPEAGNRVLAYTFGTAAERTMMVHDLDLGLNHESVLGPSERGGFGVAFQTGMGAVENPVETGLLTPADRLFSVTTRPVSVTINQTRCKVLFAGLTPGFVGLHQVNFEIPDSSITCPGSPSISSEESLAAS